MNKCSCETLPADLDWQEGKTAASIQFVNSAHEYIVNSQDPIFIGLLVDQVNKIKSGEVVLHEFLTPVEFIAHTQQR